MRQTTLSMAGFDRYARQTRKALFLAEMDKITPWDRLCALIEPFYPKAGKGRPPIGLERMLRIYCLQHWFNLSDPAVEDALYDSQAMRRFAGIDLGREPAPDETTLRIPITSAANSSLDFGQYEQPFGWAMIGSAGRRGQGVGV